MSQLFQVPTIWQIRYILILYILEHFTNLRKLFELVEKGVNLHFRNPGTTCNSKSSTMTIVNALSWLWICLVMIDIIYNSWWFFYLVILEGCFVKVLEASMSSSSFSFIESIMVISFFNRFMLSWSETWPGPDPGPP